jgi:hypothetical protein
MKDFIMQRYCKLGFLFLLSYYILICVFCAHRSLENDEWRYLSYAQNLTNGFYAPPETKFLWNGPGYPLFLSGFVLFKIPLAAAKYCNAFFLFFAIVFMYRTLRFYTARAQSCGCALLLGLYPPFLPQLPQLLTEMMGIFLISAFVYFAVKSFRKKTFGALCLASLFGGYLILTKVFFAYVITAALILSLGIGFWKRGHFRAAAIYLGCLIVCLPYLFYTYSLTGKVFYWANSGGSTLYWMSSPYPNEWGDWQSENGVFEDDRYSHHRPFFETLRGQDYMEQDRLYKEKALEQIRQFPLRYAANWISNIGRMWMDYPFAYKYQRPHTLFYMFPNALLLAGCLFSLPFLLAALGRLPDEISALGLLSVIFLGGSSLVYSCSRYLIIIVPVLLLAVFYCWTALVRVQFRETASDRS